LRADETARRLSAIARRPATQGRAPFDPRLDLKERRNPMALDLEPHAQPIVARETLKRGG